MPRRAEAAAVVGRRNPRLLPGLLLAGLDLIGLAVATYLSVVELRGDLPYCGPLHGCETVALSPYARIGGVPVAVLGVGLSLSLLALALAWVRSGRLALLAAHYALSLVGVVFEVYFTYIEVAVIGAICVWCATYGASLVARFGIALWVWLRRDRYA
ncbi:MAG: vitamin K epoxide reductase family protein [Chloroflexota bacterium]